LDTKATREHEEEIVKVKEYLQGKHGFESQEDLECQRALLPPTDVDEFVSGKMCAIARLGDTSDVCKVEKQRVDNLFFEEAPNKYTEVVGEMAGDTLRVEHKAQNLGKGVTKDQNVKNSRQKMG